jgi:hypothetical protein
MIKGRMLGRMIVLAANKHANQYDKGGRPYTGKGHNGRTFEDRKPEIDTFLASTEGHQIMQTIRTYGTRSDSVMG